MPRYLWLRVTVVLAVIVASAAPACPPATGAASPASRSTSAWTSRAASTWSSGWTSRRGSRTCSTAWPATCAPRSRRRGSAPRSAGSRGAAALAVQLASPAGVPGRPAGPGRVRRVRHAVAGRGGGTDRARAEGEGPHRAPGLLRGPGAQGHPEPRGPVRRGGADDPEAGREPHPRPAARRPGSGPGEGAHREDRGADVQAGRRPGGGRAAPLQEGPPPGDEVLYGRRVDRTTKTETGCPTWSRRRRS